MRRYRGHGVTVEIGNKHIDSRKRKKRQLSSDHTTWPAGVGPAYPTVPLLASLKERRGKRAVPYSAPFRCRSRSHFEIMLSPQCSPPLDPGMQSRGQQAKTAQTRRSRASECRPRLRPSRLLPNGRIKETHLKLRRNIVLLARSPHLVDLTLKVWREGLASAQPSPSRILSRVGSTGGMCRHTLYHSSSVGVVAAVSVEGDIRRTFQQAVPDCHDWG